MDLWHKYTKMTILNNIPYQQLYRVSWNPEQINTTVLLTEL